MSTGSNPRILVGDDRTKFVQTVMNSTFNPANTDKETEQIGAKISSKVARLVS